jgi:hypothetical protein
MSAPSATPARRNAAGLLFRLFWMVLGNLAAVVLAALIWDADGATELALSGAYWVTIALVVGARYVDIDRYDGLTAEGEPATLGHWRRHTAILLPLAAAIWGVSFFG